MSKNTKQQQQQAALLAFSFTDQCLALPKYIQNILKQSICEVDQDKDLEKEELIQVIQQLRKGSHEAMATLNEAMSLGSDSNLPMLTKQVDM